MRKKKTKKTYVQRKDHKKGDNGRETRLQTQTRTSHPNLVEPRKVEMSNFTPKSEKLEG